MATIKLTGSLMTDYGVVYVNGMDLSQVLAAAAPHRPDPRRDGRTLFGEVTVELTVADETSGDL